MLGLGKGAEIGAAILYELSGKTYVPIHDSCGNVRVVLDASGNPVDSCRYTAFGEVDNAEFVSPWRFSSKRFDDESGFYYFGRRYFDPSTGRWATPDPAGFIDGVNLYAYVHNHPLAYVDPDGRFLMFLVPIAISMALDYAVPVAALALQEYAGGAMAAALITGLAQGYNGSILETSALGASDPSLFIAEKIGVCAGALLSLNPGKMTCNLTGKAVKAAGKQLVIKEASAVGSAAGSAVANSAGKKLVNWCGSTASGQAAQTTKKVANTAEKALTANSKRGLNVVKSEGIPCVDCLSKAGQCMDRAGLTKAGRALEKHGNRPNSLFPKATGSITSKNTQGQFHLDDILTHPNSNASLWTHKRFGGIIDVEIPGQGGARFHRNGNFIGLLEP